MLREVKKRTMQSASVRRMFIKFQKYAGHHRHSSQFSPCIFNIFSLSRKLLSEIAATRFRCIICSKDIVDYMLTFFPVRPLLKHPNSSLTSLNCASEKTGPSLHTMNFPSTQLPHSPIAHLINLSKLA